MWKISLGTPSAVVGIILVNFIAEDNVFAFLCESVVLQLLALQFNAFP